MRDPSILVEYLRERALEELDAANAATGDDRALRLSAARFYARLGRRAFRHDGGAYRGPRLVRDAG